MTTSPHRSSAPTTGSVSVLGLGAMGTAIADTFVAAGHRTTVWNRTAGRTSELATRGALVAEHPADAVAASALTVICVLDRPAVDAVLDAVGAHLAGATIVNVTTGTPADARALAARVARAGGRYLDGKIMVPTLMVGTESNFVLYSGERAVFTEHRDLLHALGGEHDLLGDDVSLASVYDLAMLDVFFAGMAAFLHASALVGAEGVAASAFLPYADRIVSLLRGVIVELAGDVDRREHLGEQANLAMEVAGLAHIVEASRARGLDTSVPEVPLALARAAVSAGHGGDGFSRVIDVLRPVP